MGVKQRSFFQRFVNLAVEKYNTELAMYTVII